MRVADVSQKTYYYFETLQIIVNLISSHEPRSEFSGLIAFWSHESSEDAGSMRIVRGLSRINTWDVIASPNYTFDQHRGFSWMHGMTLVPMFSGAREFAFVVPVTSLITESDLEVSPRWRDDPTSIVDLQGGSEIRVMIDVNPCLDRGLPTLSDLCCSLLCRRLGRPFSPIDRYRLARLGFQAPNDILEKLTERGLMCSNCGYYFYGPCRYISVRCGKRSFDGGKALAIFCSMNCKPFGERQTAFAVANPSPYGTDDRS